MPTDPSHQDLQPDLISEHPMPQPIHEAPFLDPHHTPQQEFFLPVWDQVLLSPAEVQVVNHPAFQRLGDIYQLGMTHLVFRGATHRRWEHALGAVHAANLMVSAVARTHSIAAAKANTGSNPGRSAHDLGQWVLAAPFKKQEVVLIRLAALLHDLGHLASGHTFEDELGLLDLHDGDERLNYILSRTKWRGEEEEPLRSLIDRLYADVAQLSGTGLQASEIYLELVSKSRSSAEDVTPTASTSDFRLGPCRAIVGDTICADLLDYLHRDWYHLGKPRPVETRLLDYFELRYSRTAPGAVHLVVNLRSGAHVRLDAVTAIFELLESRYQLGEVALGHRTKLTATAMFERLVHEISDAMDDVDWFRKQIDQLLEVSDEELLGFLESIGKEVIQTASRNKAKRLGGALRLARALRYRQLHKQVVAYNALELATRWKSIEARLGGKRGAKNRLADCRSLEEDFNLPHGSVVIYCPPSSPHAKIAEVKVLVHDQVVKMDALDGSDSPDTTLTAGLMSAQKNRFNGLWRFQVSVSKEGLDILRETRTLQHFERAVASLVLKVDRTNADIEEIAADIARGVLRSRGEPGLPELPAEGNDVAARGRGIISYSSGAPTLRSLIASLSP